jgi:hypothetical protein
MFGTCLRLLEARIHQLARSARVDPMNCVRDYLLDNIGHMTYPGNALFDSATQHWFVPIYYRTERGVVVGGDVELDVQGHIVSAPGRDEVRVSIQERT